uniref:Small ribosomal subunit protein uS4 N-terminal domain-containing protein n=1 Tax=Xenopus tropicalis TaxID=8364 RepID=A0A803JIH2_XENTR
MVHKLKYHEQKLLKKVDFINWEVDNIHEVKVLRKYHLDKREDYTKCRLSKCRLSTSKRNHCCYVSFRSFYGLLPGMHRLALIAGLSLVMFIEARLMQLLPPYLNPKLGCKDISFISSSLFMQCIVTAKKEEVVFWLLC